MLVATFGTTTGWAGKTITFDNGQYVLEGHGPIAAQDVLEYDRQGHLTWADEGLREMVQQTASGQPAAPPTPTPLMAQPLSQGASTTPPPQKKRHGCLIALAAVAAFFILLMIIIAASGTGEEAKVTPGSGVVPAAEPVQEPEEPALTTGQQQAVETAQSYLDTGSFSRKGLIKQLRFEGFSKAEAEFAVDYIDPNWNSQAEQSAQGYLDMGGFSRTGLIDQLVFEGFTRAQAEHGVNAVYQSAEESSAQEPEEPGLTTGQQQAVESAQSYLDMGGFSRKGLIQQLSFEGFSKAEATFAVDYIDPNWNNQAEQSAQSYLDMGGFSRTGLIDQLVFEGFTRAQAEHGVNAVY